MLAYNRLSGPIPTELGNLALLKRLALGGGNQFTGCLPPRLRDVPDGDLDTLALPFCEAN